MTPEKETLHSTTIVVVRRGGKVVMAGDGQTSTHHMIVDHNSKKVHKLADGRVLVGFTGALADCQHAKDHLKHRIGNAKDIKRGLEDFAKEWKKDEFLRKLHAYLLVADKDHIWSLCSYGSIIEVKGNVFSVGSGCHFALAAAEAYEENKKLSAKEIAKKSLLVAAKWCLYTNANITYEEVGE